MKTSKTLAKILSMILVLSMLVLTVASCGLFKGSLELVSFTVDRSSVKTAYYLGEEINFTGIKAYVKYSDSSLDKEYTFADLTITYAPDITATEGQKEVKVSFQDPNLNTEVSATVLITVTEDPNAIKHASYAVDSTGMKTTYLIGDTLNFAGVKVIEKFTNGGADVEMTDLSTISYEYAQDITATPGIKTVLVKYNGESAGSISITVNRPGITEATLDTTGVTLEYLVGDTVSFTGLKAYITYENGQTATVTDFTFKTDLATLTATYGEKTVLVEYTDALSGTTGSASFKVKVDGIADYTVDTTNMTLKYLEDQPVSFAGIKVTAHYFYGKTEEVAFSALTFDHAADLTATAGSKPVTVKVGDTEAGTFIVAVGDIPDATANTQGVKLSYLVGQTVSLDGLTVTLTFTDGTPSQTLTLADPKLVVETVLEGLTATAGTKSITVKYQSDAYDVSVSFNISVYKIQSYRVVGMPDTTYIAGNRVVNYEGVKVYAVYGDPDHTEIEIDASRVTFSDEGVTATAGTKQIPVLVDGNDTGAFVTITVLKNSVVSDVLGGNYDNKYEVGETVNFAGLTITLTYLDGTVKVFNYNEITFTGDETNVEARPFKDVIATVTDINGEPVQKTFPISVIIKQTVTAFLQNENINTFNKSNADAGKTEYVIGGENGSFISEFSKGGKTYVVGDDNAFVYIPYFEADDKYLDKFYADVELTVNGTQLTKTPVPNTVTKYNYYLGNELLVEVDVYDGTYKFARPLDNVIISVKPSTEYYNLDVYEGDVKTLTVKVIDAYNVYKPEELCLIDNYDTEWDDFKRDHGFYGMSVNGIVLHCDLSITSEHVPSTYFVYSTESVTYQNSVSKEEFVKDVGTLHLKDNVHVYNRVGTDFTIEGNLFTIDTKNFPYVAPNSVSITDNREDTNDDQDYTYGGDYSNSVLFKFAAVPGKYLPDRLAPSYIPTMAVNNVNFIGNAARDNIIVKGNDLELASAGGLLLFRSDRFGDLKIDNVNTNSFFIPFLCDFGGIMHISNTKCSDSYQNAAFATRNSQLTIDSTYFYGTGGPVIITQSELVKEDDDYKGERFSPKTVVTNCVLDAPLYGDELWFNALNVSPLAMLIKSTGTELGKAGLGCWVKDNKMNIKGVLMGSGTAAALNDVDIEGNISISGTSFSRWADDDHWEVIRNFMVPAVDDDGNLIIVNGQPYFVNALENNVPFLTVTYGGQSYTLWSDGEKLYDLNMRELTAETVYSDTVNPPTEGYNHALIYQAFSSANDIVLTQGGLSVILEFYH